MNDFERRIRELGTKLSQWWGSAFRRIGRGRSESVAAVRGKATAQAKRAAARVHDLAESERGKKAASALHDLRDSGTVKKAGAMVHDLRASDAGKKAESALSGLRQREPVKKAEEGTRKVLHDMFPGGHGNADASEDNAPAS